MSRNRSAVAAAAAAAALFAAASANAQVYDFSFSGPNVSGSGEITTTGAGASSAITGVSGTILDSLLSGAPFTITGLSGYAAADNLIDPAMEPYVDFGGVSFTTTGGHLFNLGLGGPDAPYGLILNVSDYDPTGNAVNQPGSVPITLTLAAAAVPEPATWAMLIMGVAMIGFAARRRSEGMAVPA